MEKLRASMIGLDDRKAEQAVQALNGYLANLFVWYAKLHNLHWNVIGHNFFDLHLKTNEMFLFVATQLDLTAERVKMLGGMPVGSLYEALQGATLKEIPNMQYDGDVVAKIILQDLHAITNQLRKMQSAIPAEYFGNVVSGGLNEYEKYHWFFHAFSATT